MKYYYRGKEYDNEEDFMKSAKEWPFKITDEQTFYEECERLAKNIWLNMEVLKIEITNEALHIILEEHFIGMFRKLCDIKQKGMKNE